MIAFNIKKVCCCFLKYLPLLAMAVVTETESGCQFKWIVPTDLQHNTLKKDWKCRLKAKRSQKKTLPRPDLLALHHTHAVDLLNNLTSFCVSATSLKGFWSSTFSLHNDTRSFFLFFAWFKGAWPFFFHRHISLALAVISNASVQQHKQRHFKHSCSIYLGRQCTVDTNSPLTFDKAASNIGRELFRRHTHTGGQMDWTQASYTHQNLSHADDANEWRHQPRPPPGRGIYAHQRCAWSYVIPSTKKQEDPATSTMSSYLGAVHITTLKEMCKSKKLPMKKIRRQANHSSGLYLFPQLLPVGYKSKERGI